MCRRRVASTRLCSIARRYDRGARLPHQRHAGQEPSPPSSGSGRARAGRRARRPAVPPGRRRPPALQRQARHDTRPRHGVVGRRDARARRAPARRRARRGRGRSDSRGRGQRVREGRPGARRHRALGRRALRPGRPVADARRADERRLGDGLTPRHDGLARLGGPDRRRRPPVSDAARARRAGRPRRGGVARQAGAGRRRAAPRRQADAQMRRALREPGYRLPKP